ncbi:MAG: glycosyltransferase family 9 protein [Desulfovibrio sp.]|jgi:ADP-heptose:LPS heptosyltransferase|nr:glycosyltransferase family 9 protein [Desulfovibrio sp.]
MDDLLQFPGNIAANAGKTCVVFRLGRFGDVVLASGVLMRWALEFNLNFVFVTGNEFAPLFRYAPFVRETVSPPPNPGLRNFFLFCRETAERFRGSPLIDLHGVLRSRLSSRLWQGPVLRYPKNALERRLFLASGGKLFKNTLLACNVPQRYYQALGFRPPPAPDLRPRIYLSEEEVHTARVRLDGIFHPGARPVALHIHAAHPLKAIPETTARTLLTLLCERGIPCLILGRGKALLPENRTDLTNKTSLRELGALLSFCRVLVSSDSGPLHLAAAVDTPVVALFGPTTREWGFYPCGPRDIVLEKDLSCRPCSLHGGIRCGTGGQCLSSITAEDVMQAIEQGGWTS